jgi:hypothetical protein
MSRRTRAMALTFVAGTTIAAAAFAQSPAPPADGNLPARSRYLPEYAASGELVLPKGYRDWVYVGSPLTPNALNDGHAAFPEYHNVYIEPGSYAIYKKTGVFPEGTMFYKELQLTLKPQENPDGSRTEPFGTGLFPRCPRRRRGEHQGFETLCRQWRLGVLRIRSFRAQACVYRGESKRGMRLLPYRQCQKGLGLDTILPHTGRGPHSLTAR